MIAPSPGRAAALVLAALATLPVAASSPSPSPAPAPAPAHARARAAACLGTADLTRVPLAGAAWTLDARPAAPPAVSGEGEEALVTLPTPARGRRWATVFSTDESGTARLVLSHRGGPDGLLYEVVLDGQRLAPARDAWRPTPRDVRTDLGPLWLGEGSHLLEFVAREEPVGEAALHLRTLELSWL